MAKDPNPNPTLPDDATIRTLANLAQDAARPTWAAIGPPELGHYLIAKGANYTIETLLPEPAPREIAVGSLESFVAAVKHYATKPGAAVSLWYEVTGLLAVLDDDARVRRSTIELRLSHTPEWRWLERFAAGDLFGQGQLVRLLRLQLHHACPAAETVIASIRKVRFTATQSVDSTLERGRESLGKEITAELAQADLVPERVSFHIRPFVELGDPDTLAEVECLLDIDLGKQGFRLVPASGAMASVLDDELALLHKLLVEALAAPPAAEFPIFYGRPDGRE